MDVTMLKGKIHRATITHAELDYIGNIYVAPGNDGMKEFCKCVDIREDEYVMTSDFSKFIEKVVKSNKVVKEHLTAAEAEFIKIYGSFHAEVERDTYKAYAGEEYKKVFQGFFSSISENVVEEKEYDEDLLGELNVYDHICKQPNRKNCALLPIVSVEKMLGELENEK